MLLAVDVGNTQTVFGLYDGDALGERWRIATEAHRTGDELGALLGDFLDLGDIDGICLVLDGAAPRARVRARGRASGRTRRCS